MNKLCKAIKIYKHLDNGKESHLHIISLDPDEKFERGDLMYSTLLNYIDV